MPPRSALWLVPDRHDDALLRSLVDRLARRLARPSFPPHLTLCGGLEDDPARIAATVDRLAHDASPVELSVTGIESSASTFRALVLLLRPTAELLRLRHRLILALAGEPRLPTPHVSLAYGVLPPRERAAPEELVAGLELPERVCFAAIELVAPGAGGWEDVQGWRRLYRVALGGKP